MTVRREMMEIVVTGLLSTSINNMNEYTNVPIIKLTNNFVIADLKNMLVTRGEYCWLAICKANNEIENPIASKESIELETEDVMVITMFELAIHQAVKSTLFVK